MTEPITYQKFKRECGKAFTILLLFIVFSVVKIIKDITNTEYIIILIVSVLCTIGIRGLIYMAEQKLEGNKKSLEIWKSIIYEWILILLLGLLSLYVFIVKGIYGIYLLIKHFTVGGLIYRIIVIAIAYQLIVATSVIQSVFKSLNNES